MTQKFVVGLLIVTVIGAVVIGVYDASRSDDELISPVLASTANDDALDTAQTVSTPAPQSAPAQTGQPTQAPAVIDQAVAGEPVQQQAALDAVGEPWQASGTVSALDTNGMTLTLATAESIYVELGPSHFWQDMALAVGEVVSVDGFFNGQQYHAATVTRTDGTQMQLRSETGMPLWSGGASGGQAHGEAGQSGEPQVAPQDWVTLDGMVSAVTGSMLTMQTTEGDLLDLQLGQPRFIDSQGIVFAPGEAITVVGYWQGTSFKAGDITKTATGERLMLLDPNGRPLWGGPGRNGAQGGQTAQAGTQAATTITQTVQPVPNVGTGLQGQGGQGQGNQGQGGQGGQGQGNQNQGVQVPAAQWETVQGTVTLTEALVVTLRLADGSTARVMLGEVDFWTADNIWFSYGDALEVDGYWLNGEFQAGELRFTRTQVTLTIRDQFGRLLWTDPNVANQSNSGGNGQQGGQGNNSSGGGNGYQGGRNTGFSRGNGGTLAQ